MSSIMADQQRPRMSQNAVEGGSCGASANEYTGAQINFGDLTPYLTHEHMCMYIFTLE